MYNEDVTRIPTDESDMWDLLWEQFEYVRHVLWDLPAESKEEALENAYHREVEGKIARSGMMVIRYRDTGNDLDQRDYYLELGRELLPYIHQTLDERRLTPEFVQQWGKIMFCHGYIASYVFDDTDDLSNQRKGRGGRKDDQKRWIACILKSLWEAGYNPDDANRIAGRYVADLGKGRNYPKGFPAKWFNKMADSDGCLATTYDTHRMYPKQVNQLVAQGLEGIPPVPTIADLRKFANPK